ncbi:MAG: acyl--CoA ligase [Chitinophagaceae bacterium]|nr:acyl--CoA ligase [Chitinophagaceae bacterium]
MNSPDVYSVLAHAARQWPERPSIYDQWGMMSFGELYAETEILRNQLLESGIRSGMCIGLRSPNGRGFIIGLFAIVGCGAAVMPMSHQLKEQEIDEMIDEAGLHAILEELNSTPASVQAGKLIKLGAVEFLLNFQGIPSETPFAPHVAHPAFMRFTSGTTGKSKGVIISHQSVIERIEAANLGLHLGPDDTVVWVLPMAYHFVVSIVLYVRFGAAIAVARDFLARNIIDLTNRFNGSLLYASPVQIRLLANDTGTAMMPSLKKVISTSAAISLDVCEAFKKRFGINVSQAYGIIEIGLPMMNMEKSAVYPDAVGYPLPGYQVAVLDEDFNPLPSGSIGQLGIRGPGMFDAYLNPPASRESVMKNGYFMTADLASIAADGLVKIEGRSKSVINISGIKVFPEEIEAILEQIPGIKQAYIYSSPHPLLGQVIEGEIVLQEEAVVDVESVLTYCRKRLSAFKAPQRLKIVESLPMTGSGKIQRH